MAGLESIVRPFVRPDSLATRRIIASSEKIEVQPAIISWGTAGNIAAAHQVEEVDQTGTNFVVLNLNDKYTELDRKSDVRRIVQTLPDGTTNPDNYVDLNRPYQVIFEKLDPASQRQNETQVWSTAFETAQFSTVNNENAKSKSTFNLNRRLS